MRRCVGARWPSALRSALLLLGLTLGAAAQPVCKENTYPRGNKCCKECDPGEWPACRGGQGRRQDTRRGHGDMGTGDRDTQQVGLGCGYHGTSGLGTGWVMLQGGGDLAAGLGQGQVWQSPDAPAGFQMVSRCTDSRDSVCLPCQPGFYNEAVNYDTCKPCTQCNQREAQPPPPAPLPRSLHRGLWGPHSRRTNPKPQRGSLCPGVPSGTSRLPGI